MIRRVISAAVAAPLVLAVSYVGGIPFLLGALVLVVLGMRETGRLLQQAALAPQPYVALAATLMLGVTLWLRPSSDVLLLLLTLSLLLPVLLHLFAARRFPFSSALSTMFQSIYLGLPTGFLILLRNAPHGRLATIATLLTVWAADSTAYLVGRAIGRHPLSPDLSPKKTIEGAAGGLLAAALVGIWEGGWLHLWPLQGALLGFLVGVTAQWGDLIESSLKRVAGAKDSGLLLPGHGGALDRFDSVLFAIPTVYYCLKGFGHL